MNYKTTTDEVILIKVGISGTGVEGARKNLGAEIPGWDFDAVHAAAVKQWQDVFDAVQIQTFDPHLRTTFYANLYLSCLAPVLFNDVDGTYRGYDHQNHTGTNFQNYSTFSVWDIYRAEWPLLNLKYHGQTFTVVAKSNSKDNIYIQSAELNGKPLTKSWLTTERITSGGTLQLAMGPNPNPEWGGALADRPPVTMPVGFHKTNLPAPSDTNLALKQVNSGTEIEPRDNFQTMGVKILLVGLITVLVSALFGSARQI